MSCAKPMIHVEDDYFGRTVNIAARIASQAGPTKSMKGTVGVVANQWAVVRPLVGAGGS
jgi:class 3 adenylate cyclase